MSLKKKLYKNYWLTGDLHKKSHKEGVALNEFNASDEIEFYNYGCRLGNWLADNIAKYSKQNIMYCDLLEIGCGMGRLMLPLSTRFKSVTGVDFSEEVLESAKNYLRDIPNVKLLKNNGVNLKLLENNTFDMAFSSGVFQHIIDFEIISTYIKEGLRVVKEDGIFLFSFQVWFTEEIGKKRVGAKITAKKLTEALKNIDYDILEINSDSTDPVPHYCVILKKTKNENLKDFSKIKITETPWRPSFWIDLNSMESFKKLMGQKTRKITFFD